MVKGFKDDSGKFHPISQHTGSVKTHIDKHNESVRLKREKPDGVKIGNGIRFKKDSPSKKPSQLAKIDIKFLKKGLHFPDDTEERNIYKITVSRDGRSINFNFGDSIHNTERGEKPTVDDLLDIILSDAFCPETFEDFAGEFGYDPDSRRAEQIFKACKMQSKKIRSIYSENELDALDEELRERGLR